MNSRGAEGQRRPAGSNPAGSGRASVAPEGRTERSRQRPAAAGSFLRDLGGVLDGEVRLAIHDRLLYATDASIYQVEPLAVVIPRGAADVERTVRCCAEHGLPILPRGGGTSLAGQAVNAAVVIDFSAWLNGVQAIDPAARTARVEPGAVLDDLNRAAAAHGLMFGPDVATSTHATLGGMIGNNSAGAHSVLYGRTVEHLLGLDVVLADGRAVRLDEGASERDGAVADLTRRVVDVVAPLEAEIRKRYPRTRRRVNGYNLDLILDRAKASSPGTFDRVNLAHLFCGSEGTLGVTTAATVALVEAPRCKGLAIVAFADVDRALEAVAPILESGPAAVELIDDVIIDLARANIEYRRYVDLLPAPDGAAPGAVLYVEHFGETPEAVAEKAAWLETRFGRAAVRRCADPGAMAAAWKLRKAGEPLLHGLPGARKPATFVEDTAVEPGRLPEFIRRFREIVARHGTRASYYAHASVGCLHVRPMVALSDPADLATMEAIVSEVTELVMEYGGALSGEHGDGRLRSHLLERFYGAPIAGAFRAVKAIFDPENRMNPGNITAPGPMTEHLRVRPGAEPVCVPEVRTFFRYEREHGFAEAVAMCNGAGVCRKTAGGTMCPSYRATRDERHSTRGRGNALRLAVTGQFAGADRGAVWDDPETLATLDLCLSCKACKSECPSNVDVARLKAEYHAQSFARGGGPPLRVRAFGHVRTLNRLGSVAPDLANAAARSAVGRALAARLLGVDPRRTLPAFSRPLHRWFAGHARSRPAGGVPSVILLPDCFTVYNEPAIGRAAVGTLEAFGYRVVLPRGVGCCGRAMISTGLLAEAARHVPATARALAALVEEHDAVAVVGLEPSCVSAITDDWPDLDLPLDRALVTGLAARTTMLEDFLHARLDAHPRTPDGGPLDAAGEVLVHGHCHQKALWGTDGTVELLRRFTGSAVVALDSGCCGMAGAFGYTRDHYELSMKVGELALFPAVRARPEAIVAAPGTSCRHQLRDALGREAMHPVELLARAIGVAGNRRR